MLLLSSTPETRKVHCVIVPPTPHERPSYLCSSKHTSPQHTQPLLHLHTYTPSARQPSTTPSSTPPRATLIHNQKHNNGITHPPTPAPPPSFPSPLHHPRHLVHLRRPVAAHAPPAAAALRLRPGRSRRFRPGLRARRPGAHCRRGSQDQGRGH